MIFVFRFPREINLKYFVCKSFFFFLDHHTKMTIIKLPCNCYAYCYSSFKENYFFHLFCYILFHVLQDIFSLWIYISEACFMPFPSWVDWFDFPSLRLGRFPQLCAVILFSFNLCMKRFSLVTKISGTFIWVLLASPDLEVPFLCL